MLSPNDYVATALKQLDNYISFALTATTVNQYERLAVERFIEFKSKYIYKESELKRVLKFFSLIQIPIKNKVIQYPIAGHEIFWLSNLFCIWKDNETKLFDQSFISIAKGNNKSTFSSVCALYECVGRGYLNCHCICVASTKDQARLLIEIMTKIIKSSPALEPMFKINRNIIVKKDDNGVNKIEIKSSDVGGLHGVGSNLHFVLVDELAAHKNSELQTVLKSAQEAKTKNHHQLIITHSTSNRFKSPAYELQETCQNILKGSVIADNIFTQIFTLDDLNEVYNPEMWRKSNPMLSLSVPKENLLSAYDNAKIFKDKMQTFKTYNLNLWVDDETNGENWIADDVIKEVMKQDFNFNTGLTYYCGNDFSKNRDLSASAIITFNPATDKFYADVQFFFPNNERNKIKEYGSIDLSRWFVTDEQPDNYILQSEIPVLDFELVLNWFRKMNNSYNIDCVGCDPALAQQIEYRLQSELGLDIQNIEMNWKLTPAIQLLERLLLTNRIVIKQNPVLRWNFQNVLIKSSDKGNLYIKKKNKESIDGVVALAIALAVWIDNNYSRHQIMIDGFDKIYNRDLKKSA